MKVLMLNGSSHTAGNTFAALEEIGRQLSEEGIGYEIFQLGTAPIRDCTGCHGCTEKGCVFTDDGVNEFIAKAKEADGFVFGTPVYYAHPSGRILSFLDRVFYSSGSVFAFKPGAAVSVARRAGCTASVDVLNKYFGISNMVSVGSNYWNIVFGRVPGEAKQDAEGLQTMRSLARNMAWLLRCIEKGRENGIERSKTEKKVMTNFIR